nr:MAG TPA: hypothetical protein [Caudoviricetes sp.]
MTLTRGQWIPSLTLHCVPFDLRYVPASIDFCFSMKQNKIKYEII